MDQANTKASPTNKASRLFKTGLWAESISLIRRNPKATLIYLAGSFTLSWFGDDNISNSVSLVLESFIAVFLMIPICTSILKEKHDARIFGRPANPYFLNFLIRNLALNFVASIPGAIIAIAFLVYRLSSDVSSIASPLIDVIVLVIFYSKWGTMLPAVIDDADFTLNAASERGRKTWSYVFVNLLFPIILVILLFVALSLPVALLTEGDGAFYSPITGYDFTVIYNHVTTALMNCLVTTMTAVVVTRSYLLAEGRTVS